MTTILPAERSPWDVIGGQIGANLTQNLPRAIERHQGLSAIDQLQKDLEASGGDMSKVLPSLARAVSMNPALERSGLIQQFATLAQRKAGTSEFETGKGKGRKDVPTKPGEEPGQETPLAVSDLVPPRPGMVQNPQGLQDYQIPYGPEDIAAIRQKARERNISPEMEERYVKDALEYNQIAENKRTAELSNYQQQQQQRRDTLENQNAFEKYMDSHSPEFNANPDEKALALKESEKHQNETSFSGRLEKVKAALRPYQAAKKALTTALKRPLMGYSKEQIELLRPRAQMMIDMGQKPQLQLMIANGGQGEREEAYLLNHLPEQVDEQLSGFKFSNPLASVTNIDPDSPEYAKQLQKGMEKRLKQRETTSKYLAEEIRPGTYDKPGTNLLLVRGHLMDNKATWEEAGQIIDQGIREGKIKLDPQQQIDYQKLAYPPLTGETYFDTVMNNVLFPVTGKQ